MNGPTRGHDVFIPMEWLIGGADYAGKGYSAGGMSVCRSWYLITRTWHGDGPPNSENDRRIRLVFVPGMSIGKFEGVAESLGRCGLTYLLEATRTLTTTSLDMKEKPGIVTAIAKYHMTEMASKLSLNDSMDIHSGRNSRWPNELLGCAYLGIPVAITVEGAKYPNS